MKQYITLFAVQTRPARRNTGSRYITSQTSKQEFSYLVSMWLRQPTIRRAVPYVFRKPVRLRGSSEPSPNSSWDELLYILKRRQLLLRGAMIRRRMFKVPLGNHIIISLSDLCGHGAFVCLALSYLATDIIYLRASAVSGIVLSIVFQYYRDKPLWIPIRYSCYSVS